MKAWSSTTVFQTCALWSEKTGTSVLLMRVIFPQYPFLSPCKCPQLIARIVLNFANAVFWCCKVGFDALNCIRLTCHVKETSLVKFLNVFPCFLVNMVLVEIKWGKQWWGKYGWGEERVAWFCYQSPAVLPGLSGDQAFQDTFQVKPCPEMCTSIHFLIFLR